MTRASKKKPPLFGDPRMDSHRGFALVAVIWALGLIAILTTTFTSSARARLQLANNIASNTKASLIAETVVSLSIIALLNEDVASEHRLYDGEPHLCRVDDAIVSTWTEDESGKVDINNAPPELLRSMFLGLGLDSRRVEDLVKSLIEFRTSVAPADQPRSDKPFNPKHAPFETIFELDQLPHMTPDVFAEIHPFVTVHSHRPGINAQAAPPALFAALSGFNPDDVRLLAQKPFPNKLNRSGQHLPDGFLSMKQGGGSGAFLIHVEAILPTGQAGQKDAIVEIGTSSLGRFPTREIRDSPVRRKNLLPDDVSKIRSLSLPDC